MDPTQKWKKCLETYSAKNTAKCISKHFIELHRKKDPGIGKKNSKQELSHIHYFLFKLS